MGAVQAWVACAVEHDPVQGAGSGWGHLVAIIRRDAVKLGPIFFMEFFYGLSPPSTLLLLDFQLIKILAISLHARTQNLHTNLSTDVR